MPDDPLPPAGQAQTEHTDESPPRREFNARGSTVVRCPSCNLPELNCLCPYRVSAHCRVEVWLLTHPIEHYKPTNTGRLIRDVLPRTRVFTWYRTAPDPALLALLDDPRYAPFVVFPDDQPGYAERVVDVERVIKRREAGRVPVLILLDGTWRQARKIFRRSDYLAGLPVLPLVTDRQTRYRLRKPASAEHLSTAEVAAELLRQAGESQAADHLDDYFEVFNECYAASRRYIKLTETSPAMQRLLAARQER
ncbi:tRNA-uridine aminocarboxypropyltransferase [Halomonas almeriensis]|uniref:tRNA-uridine aminocarboxypropyltransferase n=1 Tax=Halomonas almeriensis TaxID=308163 RepID=UPI0025B3F8C4|nr:tRNA-uridine aminocarboxypropyltransferase [Halomonas almeriensis]MDN3551934.1 tRNA-uridine aminocarboxypropyltransferase [Halomonas almeriensis]